MITRFENLFLGGYAGMTIHVPFRMLLVVGIIHIRGIWGLPTAVGLGEVGNQSLIVVGDIPVDRFESRVVRQYVLPFGILDFHAKRFPDLHSYRALQEVFIELANRVFSKMWLVELVRVK